MTAVSDTALATAAPRRRTKFIDLGGILLTTLTAIVALIWFFPVFWALSTSLKTDQESIASGLNILPQAPSLNNYLYIIQNSDLPIWYLNSTITSVAITFLVVFMAACCGYAISQLRFPGRTLLWWGILASFMIPGTALIVNHFIIIAGVKLLNSHIGIILPLLIGPVTAMPMWWKVIALRS